MWDNNGGGRINMDRPVVEGRLRRLSWLISRWDYGNMRIWQKGVIREEE